MSTTELFTIAKSIWNHRGEIGDKYGVEIGVVPVQTLAMLLARYNRSYPADINNKIHPMNKPLGGLHEGIEALRGQCEAISDRLTGGDLRDYQNEARESLEKIMDYLAFAGRESETLREAFRVCKPRYTHRYELHSLARSFSFEVKPSDRAPGLIFKKCNVLFVLRETLLELGIDDGQTDSAINYLLVLAGREPKALDVSPAGNRLRKSLHNMARQHDECTEKAFTRPGFSPAWLLDNDPSK